LLSTVTGYIRFLTKFANFLYFFLKSNLTWAALTFSSKFLILLVHGITKNHHLEQESKLILVDLKCILSSYVSRS
jgi:hypothetical protein